MLVTAFQINESLQLEPVAVEGIEALSRKRDARLWVDLRSAGSPEVQEWLDRLGVQGLARKLCIEASDRTGFYPLTDEIFVVFPVLAEGRSGNAAEHVACLCRENLLVTIHEGLILGAAEQSTLADSQEWLSQRSVAGLISAVLIDLSLICLDRAEDLRRQITSLEVRMDRDPGSVEAEEILDARAELLASEAVVSGQLPAVRGLSATDKRFFRIDDAREYMNCAVSNLEAADGTLVRLDKRIVELRVAFQMHQQDKTNGRLGMLTILSAIFMPVTLMAGIWGMNFVNMPELGLEWGYPAALGFMVLIGGGMYGFFRRGGWFS